MRCATIYHRNKNVFVHSDSRTTAGAWILSEPCIRLDARSANDAVGRAVLDALQASRSVGGGWCEEWASFAKNASCVAVLKDPGAKVAKDFLPSMADSEFREKIGEKKMGKVLGSGTAATPGSAEFQP